ncbi:MAG: hypothetical protein E3J70_02705 [Candidatus Heimdallarchaeota archaeon]|nr:MAG: hypothetical protein E3J70_02705 [Candidatus Heimdallarchaeota archaeon]
MTKKDKLPLIIGLTLLVFLISGFCQYSNDNKPIDTYSESLIFEDNGSQSFLFPTNGSNQSDAGTGGDAGNTTAFATFITPGDYNGTLVSEDKDYFSFSVVKGNIINVTMIPHNPIMNFDLTLYTPEFDPHQNLRDDGLRETVIRSSRSTDNFTILIAPESIGDVGNYSFTISLINQNDFDSGTDAGNSFGDSLSITSGISNGTLVWGSDDEDFYQISLVKGEIIDIDLVPLNTTNVDIEFYDENPTLLDSSDNIIGINESIYYSISVPGDYRLRVILIDNIGSDIIIPYNITIIITTQNDANAGTDAGNSPDDAHFIIPLRDSTFNGHLVIEGDRSDFFEFSIVQQSIITVILEVPQTANFDLIIYNSEIIEIYSSMNAEAGADENIYAKALTNGTYFIKVEFIYDGEAEGSYAYVLNVQVIEDIPPVNGTLDWQDILLKVISYAIVPILLIVIIIFFMYEYTDVRIPVISKRLDKIFRKENKDDDVRSLKYTVRVRDEQISSLREEMIDKDSKRAKDLESLHRLEEDQKTKEKVLSKLREESTDFKAQLDDLQAVNDDLANIIDSTIRRQLSKSSKPAQKAKVSAVTALLWLSEESLVKYINSVPLLNERYIHDKSKNFILTKEFARETVRQAYWKRVGAMHLKKIKQVKVSSLAEDTNIEIDTLKEILRELVERKEIPAPIHMDKTSLLLSVSDELISELSDIAQSMPIIHLKEISKSYDTTVDSAKVIFEKIAEEGYTKGEFIDESTFIVYALFANKIIHDGSVKISTIAEENNLVGLEEEIKIIIEKLIQAGNFEGHFLTDDMFLCFTNLTDQLKQLMASNIEDLSKGDTRRVVFDTGSVVESVLKERLILDIHETEDIDKLPKYQNVIGSKELGRILRAAEDVKITLPSNIELKSLNRYWAQKIKHTKPGELPYIPTHDESKEFLFEANRALNRLLSQTIPPKWKKLIATKLLGEK